MIYCWGLRVLVTVLKPPCFWWCPHVFCDLTVFQTWKCCALSRTKLLLSSVMLSGGCIQLFHLSASWLQRTMCTGESQPGHVCAWPIPSPTLIFYEKLGIHQGLVRFLSHFQTGSRNSFNGDCLPLWNSFRWVLVPEIYDNGNNSDLYYLSPLCRGFLAIWPNKFPVDSCFFLFDMLFKALWLRAPQIALSSGGQMVFWGLDEGITETVQARINSKEDRLLKV